MLLFIARDAGPVLVHAHDSRIYHLHRRIMSGRQRIHDPVPDASPPPANEAIVASRMGAIALRQIAALGIAFNELATNAVKYGAFANETGSILIAWTLEPKAEGNRLVLHWQEKDGPPVTPPSRKGFGSRVLERGLAHELEGTVHLDYRPSGVVCTMNIPAP